jgi:hypothetical protein
MNIALPRVLCLALGLAAAASGCGARSETDLGPSGSGGSAADAGVGGSDADAAPTGLRANPLCFDGWCWESPLPQGNSLDDIWVSSAGDIWGVGFGTAVHWNGSQWSGYYWKGEAVNGVWGSSPRDVWLVGATIRHWDGASFTTAASPVGEIYDIAGSAADNVWAITYLSGETIHFDGSTWTTVPTPAPGARLTSVWTSGPTDAWAVGYDGYAIHFDGTAWTASTDQVFAGSGGSMGTYRPRLEVVGGSGPNDVWVQTEGPLVHYDGTRWSQIWDAPPIGTNTIVASSPNDVWLFGNYVAHFDGTAWTEDRSLGGGGAIAISPSNVWTVAGATFYNFDGRQWWNMNPQAVPGLRCRSFERLWASSANDVWVVGGENVILHSDGRSWSTFYSECGQKNATRLHAVHGTSATDIWMVGGEPLTLNGEIFHFDGTVLKKMDLPADTIGLFGVFALSPTDAWAVGDRVILHWDGVAWKSVAIGGEVNPVGGTLPEFRAVWGISPSDVWAVGLDGMMAHWDGTAWTASRTPVENPLSIDEQFSDFADVWGSAANDVWVSGTEDYKLGPLRHWDGQKWSGFRAAQVGGQGIWGTGPSDVWTLGWGPSGVVHWDGTSWGSVFRLDAYYASVSGLPDGNLWVIGNGMILHRKP